MPSSRPTPDLAAHLGYWLRYVSNHVSQGFARKVEAHGVTVAEWVLMRSLLDDQEVAPSRLAERMRILFVVPDYHEGKPKKCMNGWGNIFLTVTPDGTALPCHTARMLPGLSFPNVRDSSLREIWHESEGFNHYRGTGWMKQPCRDCDHKEEDLGGCRCQAFLLAGDADAADPVCPKSPHHEIVSAALENATIPDRQIQPLIFRDPKESRRLIEAAEASKSGA